MTSSWEVRHPNQQYRVYSNYTIQQWFTTRQCHRKDNYKHQGHAVSVVYCVFVLRRLFTSHEGLNNSGFHLPALWPLGSLCIEDLVIWTIINPNMDRSTVWRILMMILKWLTLIYNQHFVSWWLTSKMTIYRKRFKMCVQLVGTSQAVPVDSLQFRDSRKHCEDWIGLTRLG